MRLDWPARPRLLATWSLLALAGLVVAGFVFIWSGLYSVAASRGHWAITDWLLTFAMRNSVKTHAMGIEEPPLGSTDLVTLGAAHFHSGCAYCHGAPGIVVGPIARAMLPPPPDLATNMRPWRDRELFWIVKNGIKYTGMPAWSSQARDDEVWAMVAFLRHLPGLDAQAYRRLALGGMEIPEQSGREVATRDINSAIVGACARCHGDERLAPASKLVPILHGQPVEFLMAALQAYANAERESGIMQPVASERTQADLDKVARYYADLPLPARQDQSSPPDVESITRGRILAEQGDATAKIPACAGCHSAEAHKIYPRLAGQHQPYMSNRLRLWKKEPVFASPGDAIMAPIAHALNNRQIEDVTAYYGSLNPARVIAPAR